VKAREDILRAVRFESPEAIPMHFHVNAACWQRYPQDALQELMASHTMLFPDFSPSARPIVPDFACNARAESPYTDSWGCVWQTTEDGIVGTVTGHPLADWEAFDEFRAAAPDPSKCDGLCDIDWDATGQRLARARAEGRLATGGLPHGHTFLRLCDIRGYEGLLFDMADGEPRLTELVGLVERFNLETIRRYIEAGAEYICYAEDLGMQVGPMLSPAQFGTYIKPVYQRMMTPARQAGCIVHMHSDGDIRLLVEDLIDGGVDVLNLQDLVNGIDWIAANLRGRVCIELDVDRQHITPFAPPEQVDSLIRTEVASLGSREGGLMMIYGLYPGVPLANVKALMDAMETYATYYS
jgi:uroporphyrinogen decarboxylase